MVGFWVSATVMVKPHCDVRPDVSVAVQETSLLPIWKMVPDAGVQDVPATATLSDADTDHDSTLEAAPIVSGSVNEDGHEIEGG